MITFCTTQEKVAWRHAKNDVDVLGLESESATGEQRAAKYLFASDSPKRYIDRAVSLTVQYPFHPAPPSSSHYSHQKIRPQLAI